VSQNETPHDVARATPLACFIALETDFQGEPRFRVSRLGPDPHEDVPRIRPEITSVRTCTQPVGALNAKSSEFLLVWPSRRRRDLGVSDFSFSQRFCWTDLFLISRRDAQSFSGWKDSDINDEGIPAVLAQLSGSARAAMKCRRSGPDVSCDCQRLWGVPGEGLRQQRWSIATPWDQRRPYAVEVKLQFRLAYRREVVGKCRLRGQRRGVLDRRRPSANGWRNAARATADPDSMSAELIEETTRRLSNSYGAISKPIFEPDESARFLATRSDGAVESSSS